MISCTTETWRRYLGCLLWCGFSMIWSTSPFWDRPNSIPAYIFLTRDLAVIAEYHTDVCFLCTHLKELIYRGWPSDKEEVKKLHADIIDRDILQWVQASARRMRGWTLWTPRPVSIWYALSVSFPSTSCSSLMLLLNAWLPPASFCSRSVTSVCLGLFLCISGTTVFCTTSDQTTVQSDGTFWAWISVVIDSREFDHHVLSLFYISLFF